MSCVWFVVGCLKSAGLKVGWRVVGWVYSVGVYSVLCRAFGECIMLFAVGWSESRLCVQSVVCAVGWCVVVCVCSRLVCSRLACSRLVCNPLVCGTLVCSRVVCTRLVCSRLGSSRCACCRLVCKRLVCIPFEFVWERICKAKWLYFTKKPLDSQAPADGGKVQMGHTTLKVDPPMGS